MRARKRSRRGLGETETAPPFSARKELEKATSSLQAAARHARGGFCASAFTSLLIGEQSYGLAWGDTLRHGYASITRPQYQKMWRTQQRARLEVRRRCVVEGRKQGGRS